MSSPSTNNRNWGFRFSLTDALALLVLAAAAAALYRGESDLWWLVVLVGGHFFLFCNVFRVARKRELVWAALLLVNVTLWIFLDRMDWLHVILLQVPVSIAVVISEITGSRYHGIFANRLNSKRTNYLSGDTE
jgi:hypothetical protein